MRQHKNAHITGEKIVFKQETSDHKIKFYLAFSDTDT